MLLFSLFSEDYFSVSNKLRKVDQEYLEDFEMWYCRRMEKISWTERVKDEEA